MKPTRGYTLIELMITLAIVLILSGGGVAAFLKFNKTQAMDSDARQVVSEIGRVRALAISLQYPAGCTELQEYTIASIAVGGSLSGVQVKAVCNSGEVVSAPTTILNNSVFTAAFTATFTPGTGYLTTGMDMVINIQDNIDATLTRKITIGTYETIKIGDLMTRNLCG